MTTFSELYNRFMYKLVLRLATYLAEVKFILNTGIGILC